MARSALASLGPVRLLPRIEAFALRDLIWLRGGTLEKPQQPLIEALPWHDRFEIVSGKYLSPLHSLVPTGRIPAGTWIPLSTFIEPALPAPLLPGSKPHMVLLNWTRAASERRPGFLLARGTDWLAFAESAAIIRLRGLKFAQSADRQILIAGWPLPSLPGTYFYEEQGVAFPAGYEIQPRLSRATWQKILQRRDDELALLRLDGTVSIIPDSAWVQATRSAVRLSINAQSYA